MEVYPRITPLVLLRFNWWTVALVIGLGLTTWAFSELYHFKNPTYLFPSLTVYGTVLSLFLAFRTNEAYNRWWEARTLWDWVVNLQFTIQSHNAERLVSEGYDVSFKFLVFRGFNPMDVGRGLEE